MKFPAFAYAIPETIAEAVEILASDDSARPLAGGQSLLPMLALRFAAPTCLVDLSKIQSLRKISIADGSVRIGSMVTHAVNANAVEHREHLPLLAQAVRHVAHEAIRQRGTIGGSIAHADSASEMSLVALALDATMVISCLRDERRVAAADFFKGHYTTAIGDGELLTEIQFPANTHTWAFEEVARRPGDFALVMAAVGLVLRNGRCESARIVLGSVSNKPVRRLEAETFLVGREINESVAREAAILGTKGLEPISDVHATAGYRRVVAEHLITRALLRIMEI